MTQVDERRFEATLERGHRALGWTVVRLPFDPATVWPEMVRRRIRGEIQGPRGRFAFRSSLFPAAEGTGMVILVNRAMQQGAGVTSGMLAEIRIGPDLEERPAELPEELDVLLNDVKGLRPWYDALTEHTRREIGKWIIGVKGEEARLRRCEQMAERLLSTMEAEVQLPPALESAFRKHPRARSGWAGMTPMQRRSELFAVFYYRTSEAQTRRIGKLIENAEKRVG